MTVLDRIVDVDAINARAAKVRPAVTGKAVLRFLGRLVLFLLALPFMSVGWTAKAIVFTLIWMWSAVVVGWETGPAARVAKDD